MKAKLLQKQPIPNTRRGVRKGAVGLVCEIQLEKRLPKSYMVLFEGIGRMEVPAAEVEIVEGGRR